MKQCGSYPKFKWPTVGWVATIVAALVALSLFLFPEATRFPLYCRFGAVIGVLLLPTLLIGSVYAIRVAGVFCRRALCYHVLLGRIEILKQELDSTQLFTRLLVEERQGRNVFQIDYCYAYDMRIFIALKKKRGAKIAAEAFISVVDRKTGSTKGEFTVSEVHNTHYLCEKAGFMDAVWLGYVKQQGTNHSEPPPDVLAFAWPITTGDQDD